MELDELEEALGNWRAVPQNEVRHAVSQVVRDHQALPELLSIAAPELTTRPFEDSFEESGGPPPLDRWERWRSPGLWLLTAAVIVGAALLGTAALLRQSLRLSKARAWAAPAFPPIQAGEGRRFLRMNFRTAGSVEFGGSAPGDGEDSGSA